MAQVEQTKSEKKRIISFDLDMTLLDHRTWEIPPRALEALKLLRKENWIVIASGRDMNNAMSATYRDQIAPDGIIHLNGTKVEAEGKMIFRHQMDKERLRALLTYGENHGISLGASIEGIDYYTNPKEVIRMDERRWGVSERRFRDAWELMDLPVGTLAYIGSPDSIAGLEKHFPDIKFPMFAGKMGADVVEQEASKAKGLLRLCEFFGIPKSQTIAFGDSMNDYEIVREAGIGIAMGNGIQELKDIADYVTDAIDQDGVWNACRHFHLI